MLRRTITLITLVAVALALLPIDPSAAQDDPADPATLPLLPAGRHVGTMFYGGGAPPPDALQPRIDDATAAGMSAFTVYLDWPVLEPEPGVYDLSELTATLDWAAANGLSTFANITLLDIEELVMPPEFLVGDESTAYELADGMRLNDPELVGRFLALLDEVVPLMVEHGVFYLGVGNEVDGWLSQNPAHLPDYLQLIQTAREHVHTIAPELAVGVTVTGFVPLEDPALLAQFYQVADIVSSNIYAIDARDWTVADEALTTDLLERFIAAFDGRPIVIPEFGCPSALSMESSPEIQGACFATMMDILAEHENVRFATVFTLSDFDPEVCAIIQRAFGFDPEAGYENIYDERVAEYLCTSGMVLADGTPKPAFDAFLEGIPAITGTD